MAIYTTNVPYLITKQNRVALPKICQGGKLGFDNLCFLFTNSISQSIKVINNKDNCYNESNSYKVYYYNLLYRGKINGRIYNIKNINTRKDVYARINKETTVSPHPSSLLNKTPNRNTYFEMSKYYEIYKFMTKSYSPIKKVNIFWNFFTSVWFSEQTSTYSNKFVLINADHFSNFNGKLSETIDNPLFMLYYTMYRKFDLIKDLDIDFIIYCKKSILKINPSKCDEKSYLIFKRELNKVLSKTTDVFSDETIIKEEQKEILKESLTTKYNFTGDDSATQKVVTTLDEPSESSKSSSIKNKEDELKQVLDKKVDEKINENLSKVEAIPEIDNSSKEVIDFVKVQSENDLDNDKELIENMYKVMRSQKVPSTPLSTARDQMMRERQESITVGNLSMKDLNKINVSKRLVPEKDVSKTIKNLNENVKTVKFANLNKDYIENVYQQDILKAFLSLNEKSSKFYVRDVKVTDSSDELNYKETYHIILEDEHKQRHSIAVDVPKFIDNKFMYLGGNKKIIDRQNFLMPVVKTAPDTVQIVTNYNKMFVRRIGTKSIASVERVMKLISNNDDALSYFTTGDNSNINRSYVTTLEYDQFGKVLTKFQTNKCIIFFNCSEANEYAEKNNINIPKNHMFIGIKDKKPIFINYDTQTTSTNETICDLLVTELPENLTTEFNKTRSTKKLTYNTVTVMSQTIPFIVLLMYWEGATSVFNKLGLKYYFSPKYPSEIKPNEAVIRFKDSYFVYEEDMAISLLMNGIKVLDTENYDLKDYNTAEPYLPYFKKVYGKVSIVNTLSNFYDFVIDPITKEILEDTNLPTDLIELCIYASNLLADESYTIESSQRLARIRSIEVIPAMLYNELSRAYIVYKNSAGKKKMSIAKDSVIKQLLALQTVEDYSTLNPSVELEKDRALTSKGYRGNNVDRAYSEEKRSYDPSMIGIVAMSTSPDGNCGINRFLTMEPNITSVRGYVDIKEDNREELKDVNLFSPAELLYPLGNTRDDSIRTAMAVKQSKHTVPVLNSSPALMTNGVDEAIKFNLSSDFIVNAEEDGTVIDYDQKSGIMMVEYKSGKHRAINLAPNIVKNGGGGFYLNNLLVTKYKVGDKFKKDDTLAWHKDFFKDDKFNGIRMNVGNLEKIAIATSYNTYNDSTVITNKLAHDATSEITFCKSVVIGKNSNIYSMRNIGDEIEVGDSLLDYDVSFEDSELNKLLSHLSDENKEVFEESSKNSVKSKYAGRIVDIKIYSSVDVDELSDSLKKIVNAYYKRINDKKKFLTNYDTENGSIVKCGLLLNESTGKVEPNIYGVIKGQKVQDSVLIEFYIEHGNILGVGDKLAFFTALKGIVGEVIPEGYEPHSEFRPDEELSALCASSSILKRQTPSILLTILGNKVIVELKRKLEEIYNS